MEEHVELDLSKVTYTYKWLHILSGTTGLQVVKVVDRMEFLELLNEWNRVANGAWVYIEV